LMATVYIPRPAELEHKIAAFREGGYGSMQVVSDFDRTLTLARVAGVRYPTSFGVLQASGLMPQGFIDETMRLSALYRPIELSPLIGPQEKLVAVEEWCVKTLDAAIAYGISRQAIYDCASMPYMRLRPEAKSFLGILQAYDVPITIPSGGLGDMISSFLEARGVSADGINLVSNFFTFDESGLATGYGPVIHALNKPGHVVATLPKDRRNILILGDMIEDSRMVEGYDFENTIKVGFLEDGMATARDVYSEHFDMLVLNDGDMKRMISLIRKIA
jgi:HAD superfamily hydrolase (TIGR01544 family)